MSHEIANRTALRELIGGLSSWQTWTGQNEAGATARIAWPDQVVTEFPFMVLVMLAGGRRNLMGSDSSANFRSKGGIGVLVFDKMSDPDDFMTSDTAFGTKFFGLLDDLVEAAHETELMIEDLSYGDNPYTLGPINSAVAADADADDEDDTATITEQIWMGIFQIQTGVA